MKKTALVTGGTRGIGAASAQALKENGFNVAVTYVGNDEQARLFSSQTGIKAYKWNVADYEQTEKGVKQVVSDMGRPIGVLINNAGVTRDKMFHKMLPQEWNDVITINLNSLFNVTRQVIENMRENNYGRIINISSINAQKGQVGQTNYCSTKGGAISFTKALAQEVANKNITVNAIAPGYIKTSMMEDIPEQVLNNIVEQIPVKRLGQAEEIADVVKWLASEKAGFITGSVVSINGGQYCGG